MTLKNENSPKPKTFFASLVENVVKDFQKAVDKMQKEKEKEKEMDLEFHICNEEESGDNRFAK